MTRFPLANESGCQVEKRWVRVVAFGSTQMVPRSGMALLPHES